MTERPSGDHDGIEARPDVVSWRALRPLWIQTLPLFTYTMEPGTSDRGSTTTTFDGAGVRVPPPMIPPLPSGVVPPPPGSRKSPVTSPRVSQPTTSSPTIASTGPSQSGTGATPYGSRGGGRRLT
jgi:hypothetical protein